MICLICQCVRIPYSEVLCQCQGANLPHPLPLHSTCTGTLSEARTTLPESSSRPLPAKTAPHSRNLALASLETAVMNFQVNRLQSTAARAWAQRSVPPQIRESVLSLVTRSEGDDDGGALAVVDKVLYLEPYPFMTEERMR